MLSSLDLISFFFYKRNFMGFKSWKIKFIAPLWTSSTLIFYSSSGKIKHLLEHISTLYTRNSGKYALYTYFCITCPWVKFYSSTSTVIKKYTYVFQLLFGFCSYVTIILIYLCKVVHFKDIYVLLTIKKSGNWPTCLSKYQHKRLSISTMA